MLDLAVLLKLPDCVVHFVGASVLYVIYFIIIMLTIVELYLPSNKIIYLLYSSIPHHTFIHLCIMVD